MADISGYIADIESASTGEEVRDSIVDAFNAVNVDLPAPTASDSGKYLRVNSSGDWVLASVPNAEGVSF